MKTSLLSLVLTLCVSAAVAQTFDKGNDWYRANPGLAYVKMLVAQEGIYRVTAQELQAAGLDLAGKSHLNVQLYYRGKQVRRYIQRDASGEVAFVEFYGKPNDGRVDSMMYRSPDEYAKVYPEGQPNKEVSLFSDTSAYFITWNPAGFGLNISSFVNLDYSLPAITQVRSRVVQNYLPGVSDTEYLYGGGGSENVYYVLNSDYNIGEGYLGHFFACGKPATVTLNTPLAVPSGQADLEVRLFGRSTFQHRSQVFLDNTLVIDTLTDKVNMTTIKRTLSQPIGSQTQFRFEAQSCNNASQNPDNNHVAFIGLIYPRQTNLSGGNQLRIWNWQKDSLAHLRFSNVAGNDSIFVYDLTRNQRIGGMVGFSGGGNADVVLPKDASVRQLFVATDLGIRKPVIVPHRLSQLHNPPGGGADYVIITSRKLAESAQAYQTYRDTCTVGDTTIKTAMIVYTDEIYDEYGYGTVTPWAIKRFCKDTYDSWTIKPKYFLLWGKGSYYTRGNTSNLVPTFNYPATDYEFVGHYENNNDYRTWAAIGRVNVYNNTEGMAYLDKVMEYEHQKWDAWMKNGVFLGGGQSVQEQLAISGALKVDSVLFTDPPFGGRLTYYQKSSSDVIEDNPDAAEYHDKISAGVSLIHFFGHSTNNIQDIKIREAGEYQNYGRYPFMIAFGCYGGDFSHGKSFGELWITEPDRGSIGYFANSSAGYLAPLASYAKIFYPYLYGEKGFGVSVGENIRQCLAQFVAPNGVPTNSKYDANHGRQLNLQGDPAIILLHPTKPDLAINESSVYFYPDNFTAQSDSFDLRVIVKNDALAPPSDSVRVSYKQLYPNGSDTTIYRTYPMVASEDTFSLRIFRQLGQDNTGENRFEVTVDYTNSLIEYNESNNFTSIRKVIPGNIPAPVYPVEFAIIDSSRTYLAASSYFMTRDSLVNYIFQIDTSHTFSSPLMRESPVVSGKATYARWEPDFALVDSTVYYWRVRLADFTPEVWATSSFKYIPGKTGWSQGRLPQFVKDNRRRISPNLNTMQWQFDERKGVYEFAINKEWPYEVQLTVNNNLPYFDELGGSFYFCNGNMLTFMLVDQHSLVQKRIIQATFPASTYDVQALLEQAKAGDYLFIGASPRFSNFMKVCPSTIYDKLENEFGFPTGLRTYKDSTSIFLALRKGDKVPLADAYNIQPNNTAMIVTLRARWPEGRVTSPLIGPTNNWKTFDWDWKVAETPLRDRVTVDVYGVRKNSTDSLIFDDLDATGLHAISQVNADDFPYLRLVSTSTDSTYFTAPQLRKWQVYHDKVPDAVVEVVNNFTFDADTVAEGRDVTLYMAAENPTNVDMDSLLVQFYLEREDRTKVDLGTQRLAPLLANGRLEFSYIFNTREKELDGDTRLFVILNPDLDQVEQHFFNNVYIHNFYVQKDQINPILDVTINGKHILNGDYVSPTPEIHIRVQDENEYLAMDDTTSFELYFQGTTGFSTRVPFSDPRIEWRPATLPNNEASLIFRPGLETPLEDTEAKRYKLRIQSRDKTRNASGANSSYYEVEFQVRNQSAVSNVVNYPNPFSSSTRFVYTLTGDKIPTRFEIQIYTITGKLVKVIDLLAHESVFIGNNITEYAWDGTDAYGDPLANGVYLYKVVTEIPGADSYRSSDIEIDDQLEANYRSLNDGTRDYFTKGWGKMYLMR